MKLHCHSMIVNSVYECGSDVRWKKVKACFNKRKEKRKRNPPRAEMGVLV